MEQAAQEFRTLATGPRVDTLKMTGLGGKGNKAPPVSNTTGAPPAAHSASVLTTSLSGLPSGPLDEIPLSVSLSLAQTWQRNSELSKGIFHKRPVNPTAEEQQLELHTQYNEVLGRIKTKLEQRGKDGFLQAFDRYDTAGGHHAIPLQEVVRGLRDLNLTGIPEGVLRAVLGGSLQGDAVDVRAFAESVLWGRVDYRKQRNKSATYRKLLAPDPADPLGDTQMQRPPPFALGAGGDLEGLEVTRRKIRLVQDALRAADSDKDGWVTYPVGCTLRALSDPLHGALKQWLREWCRSQEFFRAIQSVNRPAKLMMSEHEIVDLFRVLDTQRSSRVKYDDLVSGGSEGEAIRIPEFLRPKRERASQAVPPWVWGS